MRSNSSAASGTVRALSPLPRSVTDSATPSGKLLRRLLAKSVRIWVWSLPPLAMASNAPVDG